MALAILLPLGVGIWIDQQRETAEGWFTLAGVVLGTLLGTIGIYLLTRAQYRALDKAAIEEETNSSQRPSTPQPPKIDDMKEDDS